MPFVYESLYGGAEMCELGRHTVRLSTKQQALTLGSKMRKGNAAVRCRCGRGLGEGAVRRHAFPSRAQVTYSVYKLGDGEMRLLGSYPKGVNADGTCARGAQSRMAIRSLITESGWQARASSSGGGRQRREASLGRD